MQTLLHREVGLKGIIYLLHEFGGRLIILLIVLVLVRFGHIELIQHILHQLHRVIVALLLLLGLLLGLLLQLGFELLFALPQLLV